MSSYDDIDPIISNQRFAIISYVLPQEDGVIKNPMLKIRGSYKTSEECTKKIKSLQLIDSYFSYYLVDVGQWGCLLTYDQINDKDINIEHINKEMDDFIKSYREERDKNSLEFERRRSELVNKIKFDGTPEGQEILSNQREHFISVKHRLEFLDNKIKSLTEELREASEMYAKTQELYNTYTEEEIAIAEKEFAEVEKKNK
jgi:hypothetical protein